MDVISLYMDVMSLYFAFTHFENSDGLGGLV